MHAELPGERHCPDAAEPRLTQLGSASRPAPELELVVLRCLKERALASQDDVEICRTAGEGKLLYAVYSLEVRVWFRVLESKHMQAGLRWAVMDCGECMELVPVRAVPMARCSLHDGTHTGQLCDTRPHAYCLLSGSSLTASLYPAVLLTMNN